MIDSISLTIIEDDETCIRYTVLVAVVISLSLTNPPNITALVLLIFSMMKPSVGGGHCPLMLGMVHCPKEEIVP